MTWPGPPHATSTDLLVLHALRCIGFAGLGRVAAAAGLPEPDVESELIDLEVAGLVSRVAGDFGGWGLTEAGRAVDAERIAGELETAGTRTVVTAAYDGFLVLNPELLDLCTAWQMRSVDGVVTLNDHSDPGYDARSSGYVRRPLRSTCTAWPPPPASSPPVAGRPATPPWSRGGRGLGRHPGPTRGRTAGRGPRRPRSSVGEPRRAGGRS